LAVISNVVPSGAARDTASVPIIPLAPGRFSITIVTPCARLICSAIRRATKSVLAPAGTGTTSLMVPALSERASWPDNATTTMAKQAASALPNDII
jgi:hypothetical protein